MTLRVLLLAGLLPALGFAEKSVQTPQVREAVELALPYLESEGTWWIEKKECVSCHHTTFLVWAKDLALQAGFEMDEAVLDEQRRWVWESLLADYTPNPENKNDEAKPGEINVDRNVEGAAQLLVSASAKKTPEEIRARLKAAILKNRQADGAWKPNGQLPLQKRPKAETTAVSGQWARIALAKEPEMNQNLEPKKTTEWFAMNAILVGDDASVSALLKRQNEDGGWSWKDGEGSDPMATGQALFALARVGAVEVNAEAVGRAKKFLIETQSGEGSWETQSTKNRAKTTDVSDFWGTAWAVIGLLESENFLAAIHKRKELD